MNAMGFAVRRADAARRFDPNYHSMNRVVATYLSAPLFPLARIADVTRLLQYGCSRRATCDASGTPILRMSNMQKEGWLLDDVKFVELTPDELALWRLQVGDVVFNRTNSKDLVGKCEVFDRADAWVFASYLMRLRVDTERVLPAFLRDFLSGGAGRAQIDRDSRQIAGMSNINADELRGVQFPCPDLKTQYRLVASMNDARSARHDRLCGATALLEGLDRYVLQQLELPIPPPSGTAVWATRTGGGDTLRLDANFHYPRYRSLQEVLRAAGAVPLGELCVFSRERADPSQGPGDYFRYIEIGGVSAATGEASAVATVRAEAPSMARMLVHSRDVVVSLTRPSRGAIGLIDESLEGCVASTGFAVLTQVNDAVVSPEYLWAFLRTQAALLQMLQRASGGNYPAISEDELKRVLILVPTRDVQDRIVAEVARRRAEVFRLRAEAAGIWSDAQSTFDLALLGRPALQRGSQLLHHGRKSET